MHRAKTPTPIEVQAPEPAADTRLPYRPPRLEVFGDVRELTLGGSPGVGDSGDPLNTQPPIGP